MKELTIGKVASQAGVNLETIRYYERRGILRKPLRGPSGYRQYDPETVGLIRFIKGAQQLGFTLKEIQDLLRLRENPRGNRSQISALAQAKLGDIEKKIQRLQGMRQALEVLLNACACKSQRLDCPIIESLNDGENKYFDKE